MSPSFVVWSATAFSSEPTILPTMSSIAYPCSVLSSRPVAGVLLHWMHPLSFFTSTPCLCSTVFMLTTSPVFACVWCSMSSRCVCVSVLPAAIQKCAVFSSVLANCAICASIACHTLRTFVTRCAASPA
ncbi:hypothetical protein TRVL_02636 [Trypanosoma vivax]|nr:hypothetical protein TRVL_02636 [Trypanosoma vivax]